MIRASVIIVAAGQGVRLGLAEPKAFVRLGAHPILFYSFLTIREVSEIAELIVALPSGKESETRTLVKEAKLEIPVKLTSGGVERRDSVRKGLDLVSAETDIAIIHDAARPFAEPELFRRCIFMASQYGGAVAAVPVADTLKQVENGVVVATVPRQELFRAQTPQAFRRELLLRAYTQQTDNTVATDDCYLVEQIGGTVKIVEGGATNFKITDLGDLKLAQALMAERTGRY